MIYKYPLPDHLPALRKTLEAAKALESKLQRRVQFLQTSVNQLKAADVLLFHFLEKSECSTSKL